MVRVPTGKGLDSLNFSTGTSGWSPKAFSLSCSDMGGMERGRIGHERCQESKSKMQLKSDSLFHEAILEAVSDVYLNWHMGSLLLRPALLAIYFMFSTVYMSIPW